MNTKLIFPMQKNQIQRSLRMHFNIVLFNETITGFFLLNIAKESESKCCKKQRRIQVYELKLSLTSNAIKFYLERI